MQNKLWRIVPEFNELFAAFVMVKEQLENNELFDCCIQWVYNWSCKNLGDACLHTSFAKTTVLRKNNIIWMQLQTREFLHKFPRESQEAKK